MIALDKKEDPPYDMKGRVIPFVGNKFILVEIFIIVWKIKILPKPKVELRTKKLLVLWQIKKILKYIIRYKQIIISMAKIPNSSPIKAKMKSECASGKLFDIFPFPRPCPNNPPLANDSKDLFIW